MQFLAQAIDIAKVFREEQSWAQIDLACQEHSIDLIVANDKDPIWEDLPVLETQRSGARGSGQWSDSGQDSRSPIQVTLMPLYHWTGSKIRVHLFVCVAAMTYIALLCQRLNVNGFSITSREAMDELRSIKTAIYQEGEEGKLRRMLEKVNEDGEEYFDITPCEAALIDKFAEVCAGFRYKEDPKLPVSVRRANDEQFAAYNQRQFAYKNRKPTNG